MDDNSSQTAAIIQARMGSSRLPGKSMHAIAGLPVLAHVIKRAQLAERLEHVHVATSVSPKDDPIVEFCETVGVGVFQGSEGDVLDRMYRTAKHFDVGTMVRITADNPLVGPEVIDFMVDEHRRSEADFTTSYHSKSFPNGTVVSVIETEVLKHLHHEFLDPEIREHIVSDLDAIRSRFEVHVTTAPKRWHRYDLRYCIDYEDDLQLVTRLVEHFSELEIEPTTEDIIQYLDDNKELKDLNRVYAKQGY